MPLRLLTRVLAALALLGATVPAWASAGSPLSSDRASDGRMPGVAPGTPQANSNWLQGIDVSHWNGSIDWQKVHDQGGKSFAIMKATDGRSYVDPTYADNRDGAIAAGMIVTAYHFARPDNTKNDAKAEADHFVKVTGMDAPADVGDIIPVLDLERTGGLSHKAIVQWVWDWVKEVQRRTRVRPMIYTGYYGWQDRTGDTQEFADAGYKLWVANWYVKSPSVPAGNWGGHGWTFWQYTDRGRVPGMSGGVDLDYYGGPKLTPALVPILNVTTNQVGTVTSKPPGIDCGSTCSRVFDPGATVTLTATPSPGAVLVSWSGACTGTAVTCQVKALGNRTATASFGYTLTAQLAGLGQGMVTSAPGDITCDESTSAVCSNNFVAGADVTLTATPAPGSQFDGWSGACDGSFDYTCQVTMDQARTVTANFADDTPPTPTLHTPATLTAPGSVSFDEPVHDVTTDDLVVRVEGATTNLPATVACAGQRGGPVDCGAGQVLHATVQPDEPLVPGQHYDVVVNPIGASSQIVDRAGNPAVQALQPFRAQTSLQETSLPGAWSWQTKRFAGASDGSYAVATDPGAAAVASFRGGPVVWHTLRGPGAGVAQVSIDGHGAGIVDLAAPRTHLASIGFRGIGAGAHVIRVTVLRGRTAGVAVDGFGVLGGGRVPDEDISYRWMSRHAGGASGGSYVANEDAGAAVRFRFRGTAIRWLTTRGPDQGRAEVFVDGSLRATYSEYAPSREFGVSRTIGNLSDAVHTIRIVVVGTSRPAATAAFVSVDGFEIS